MDIFKVSLRSKYSEQILKLNRFRIVDYEHNHGFPWTTVIDDKAYIFWIIVDAKFFSNYCVDNCYYKVAFCKCCIFLHVLCWTLFILFKAMRLNQRGEGEELQCSEHEVELVLWTALKPLLILTGHYNSRHHKFMFIIILQSHGMYIFYSKQNKNLILTISCIITTILAEL